MDHEEIPQALRVWEWEHGVAELLQRTCSDPCNGSDHQRDFGEALRKIKEGFVHLYRHNTDKDEREARQDEMIGLNLHYRVGAIAHADPTELH